MKNRFVLFIIHFLSFLPLFAQEDTTGLVHPLDTADFIHNINADLSLNSLPWIIGGIALRDERENFREIRQKFTYSFNNKTDNYSQYVPLALTTALKAVGYEGRSDWNRYLVSTAASFAMMAVLVNTVKYSAKELRPDGTTYNSFPSGHTATAFAAATILHKEYGMTRSPWFSVAGYALATATGCMRVLNNRHWVSDTFAGAGVGILSTEIGYAIGDLLFKGKGLLRNNIDLHHDLISSPSFFSVYSGIGLGKQSMQLPTEQLFLDKIYDDEIPVSKITFGTSSSVGIEGAYFFNRYFGIGGNLRVRAKKVNNWTDFTRFPLADLSMFDPVVSEFIQDYTLTIESNHISEFMMAAGAYFNLPLSSRFAIGSKLLLGRNYMHGIKINAHASGLKKDVDIDYDNQDDNYFLEYEITNHKDTQGKVTANKYSTSWQYLNVEGNNSLNFVTGLSLTYAYKSYYTWKLFVDYDLSKKDYAITYSPTAFIKDAAERITFRGQDINVDNYIKPYVSKQHKMMSSFVLGAAFCVSF